VRVALQRPSTPLARPAQSRWRVQVRSTAAWGSPASIPLGSVGHTGSRLGRRRNSTSRQAVRVGHRPVGMARRRVPMPATVGVPRQGADPEQHGDHDQYSYPLRSCLHGHPLSVRAHPLMLPGSVPTISLALPEQSHVCADDVSRVLTCASLVLLTPSRSRMPSMLAALLRPQDRTHIAAARSTV
jgi:hypothetical protein